VRKNGPSVAGQEKSTEYGHQRRIKGEKHG
jgi:hypothetical protein